MRTPREILAASATIAVVGASQDESKPSHYVPLQMRRYGWRIIPVNPWADEVWGERCYPKLADVPEPVDLVNVFRPAPMTPDITREAAAVGAHAVWLQLGIVSAESRRIAEEAGLDYVEDLCIMVQRSVDGVTRLD